MTTSPDQSKQRYDPQCAGVNSPLIQPRHESYGEDDRISHPGMR